MNETKFLSSKNTSISFNHTTLKNQNTSNISLSLHDNNFAYSIGRLIRYAFNEVSDVFQRWWYPKLDDEKIAAKIRRMSYKKKLEAFLKNFDLAIEKLRKNPKDLNNLRKLEILFSSHSGFFNLTKESDLKIIKENTFNTIKEKIKRIKNKFLEKSVTNMFDFFLENLAVSQNKKRNLEKFEQNSLNFVNLPEDDQIEDILIEDNYLYTTHGNKGFKIFDITDSNNPKVLGKYDTPGYATTIVLHNGYAYIADGIGGVQIINIKDPNNPVFAGMWMTYETKNEYSFKIMDLSVLNNLAYISFGNQELLVIDVSTPEKVYRKAVPLLSNNPTDPKKLIVSNNLAYVLTYNSLEVIDINNKIIPKTLVLMDGLKNPNGIAISGNIICLVDDFGLKIIDIYPPSYMVLGSLNISYANNVFVAQDKAYILTYNSVKIIDISDTSSPKILGTIDVSYPLDAHVFNNFLCLTSTDNALILLNVSDPTQPEITGSIRNYDFLYSAISVSGNLAYLANNYRLGIFDISKFSMPSIISSIDFPIRYDGNGFNTDEAIRSIVIQDNIVCIPNYMYGIQLIDVSDIYNPKIMKIINIDSIRDIDSYNGLIYFIDQNGLQIIDINRLSESNTYNFANPILGIKNDLIDYLWVLQKDRFQSFYLNETNLFHTENKFIFDISRSYFNNFRDLKILNNTAYVLDDRGFKIVDVNNQSDYTMLGKINKYYPAYKRIAISKNRVYLSYKDGIDVADISNLYDPIIIGKLYSLDSKTEGIYFSDDILYATNSLGIQLINVTKNSAPKILSSINISSSAAHDVVVLNNIAFVLNDIGLQLIDVKNTSHPEIIASVYFKNKFEEYQYRNLVLSISENIAYVVGHRYGLIILDISNPLSPIMIEKMNIYDAFFSNQSYLYDYIIDIAISKNIAYFHTGGYLGILNITNPKYPLFLGGIKYNNLLESIAQSSMSLYEDIIYISGFNMKSFDVNKSPFRSYYLFLREFYSPVLSFSGARKRHYSSLADYRLPRSKDKMTINSNFAFFAFDDYSSGKSIGIISVLDISDPSEIKFVTKWNVTFIVDYMIVKDKKLFLTDGEKITIFEISNIQTPQLLENYNCTGDLNKFSVHDNNIVYISAGSNCEIEKILISNPTTNPSTTQTPTTMPTTTLNINPTPSTTSTIKTSSESIPSHTPISTSTVTSASTHIEPSMPSQTPIGNIIGAVIPSFVVLAAAGIGFFAYKKKKWCFNQNNLNIAVDLEEVNIPSEDSNPSNDGNTVVTRGHSSSNNN